MASDILSRIKANQIAVEGISSDSRNIKQNFIFFAIKGDKNNGNDYIDEVLKK
jgi:UDP-N-acetylmuramoyl-L-alanyl-D-glutamate--2,6-diaminopimelate ligase